MKTFCVLFLVAVVVAEPPVYRQARYSPERQRAEGAAPYPAAGFEPVKKFELPSRQELNPPATSYGIPADSYGAPFNTYAVPQAEYGVPEGRNGKEDKSEVENIENNKEEGRGKKEESKETKGRLEEAKSDAEVISAQGAYYVLLPGSQLQRVQFQTENDIRNMAYTARLQYKNEDRAPIFVYTAVPQYQTAAYVQLA